MIEFANSSKFFKFFYIAFSQNKTSIVTQNVQCELGQVFCHDCSLWGHSMVGRYCVQTK